jgi:NAD(P)H-nitrite reductase large subunit
MLKPGEKGAISQRDGQTCAVAPRIPCGLITPDLLRRLTDAAEKYQSTAVTITGATRVAITGLPEADIDRVWEDLKLDKGAAVGLCVRSIRTCPGNSYCRIGQQDAIGVGLKMGSAVYTRDAKKGERLGKTIDRIGLEPFKVALA